MKSVLLLAASGPLVILTSFPSALHPTLLAKLAGKGIRKFIAFDLPLDQVRWRYGGHFTAVMEDLAETDDLRVLDFDGHHIYDLFRFSELGPPVFHESA
ncbi:MAG: hypothetical protein KGI51_07350 [Rhodospirillales bacterium]|nr:hypothetical protein [Rhodospirillales bacterium]